MSAEARLGRFAIAEARLVRAQAEVRRTRDEHAAAYREEREALFELQAAKYAARDDFEPTP